MYVLQHSVKHLDEILIVRDTNEITELNINLKYTHTHTHTLYAYTCTFMYIYISVWYTWIYIHIHVCLFKCVFIHTYTIYGCIYGLRDTIQRECFIHLVRGYRLGIYCFFFTKVNVFPCSRLWMSMSQWGVTAILTVSDVMPVIRTASAK